MPEIATKEDFYASLEELFVFRTKPENIQELDIECVKNVVDQISEAIYTTEMFEEIPAQLPLMQFLHIWNKPVILGIKNNSSLYPLKEKVCIWRSLLPSHSCIFVLPGNMTDEDILKYITVYKNPHIIHLYPYTEDRREQRKRRSQAFRGMCETFNCNLTGKYDISIDL